jgi:2-polyprenyl-6-hydroxyphenyl methylase/3-demethylubiquinone-9 3-methyltransferase
MNLRWRIAQAAEEQWWRRYLRKQDPVVYLHNKRTYWQQLLKRLELQLSPNDHILDAGCGPAGIFIALPEHRVDALDPLLEHYMYALSHFNPADYAYVRFWVMPLETFTRSDTYNIIFCMNAINHVADLQRSLHNLVAALRPGGRLVLTVDVHRYAILKGIFRCIPGDILHPHQHGAADYCAFLEAQGCRVTQITTLKSGRIFDYVAIVALK